MNNNTGLLVKVQVSKVSTTSLGQKLFVVSIDCQCSHCNIVLADESSVLSRVGFSRSVPACQAAAWSNFMTGFHLVSLL